MNTKKLLSTALVMCWGIFGFSQTVDTLIGRFDRSAFLQEPFLPWFMSEYQDYPLEIATLQKIHSMHTEFDVLIYLGTWCSDSRREVPRFLKMLDYLEFDFSRLDMTGLNRKKQAPDYPENIWNIEYVPTFIFLKDGKEIGRIIETPEESLESDMLKILSGT